jgi:regulator of protease activity HflC (stomatin/prohibitin superfamily)
MIENYRSLSLELMSFDVAPQQDLYTSQGVAVTVEAVAQIKVKSDPESIETAAEQFLTKTAQEREGLIRLVMEGHLRGIIGQLTVEEIVKQPEMVGDRMRSTCADDMNKMGLEVISFTIKEVRDKNEYISNMGRPDVARIKRDADVAAAEASRDTAIRQALAQRESAVARAQADQERVLAETLSQAKQAEAQRDLEIKKVDLTFNPIARFYEAPIQMKANGGVFVVDDFGRQRIPPRDLLNRWIVPLESRVDFLTLHTGRKFEIPFNVLIVFATNLKPESLADEAFMRRIPYKILAKNPTMDEYCRIFEMNCRKRGLAFDPVMVEYLSRKYYQPRKLQMRACHPRDLVEQVVNICRYQNRDLLITRELLDAACGSYFLEEIESQGSETSV